MTKIIAMGRTAAGLPVPLAVDATGRIIVSGNAPQFDTLIVGAYADGNYFEVEADGTWELNGNATTWRDELGPLIGSRLESPASDIIQNNAEGSLSFKDSATTADYVILNLQLNHDWELSTAIEPHFHWWQAQAAIPNWLIQYRWQSNGNAKTAAWTSAAYDANVFTYSAGTLNQITDFPAITPPANAGLSDILQIRFIRDTANASGLFAGADAVVGNVDVMSFDVHRRSNTMGSRQEYVK